jgi:hypothetical protein
MALKEEFEYVAFRCAYCLFYNESRKTKLTLPRPSESSKQQQLENSNIQKQNLHRHNQQRQQQQQQQQIKFNNIKDSNENESIDTADAGTSEALSISANTSSTSSDNLMMLNDDEPKSEPILPANKASTNDDLFKKPIAARQAFREIDNENQKSRSQTNLSEELKCNKTNSKYNVMNGDDLSGFLKMDSSKSSSTKSLEKLYAQSRKIDPETMKDD